MDQKASAPIPRKKKSENKLLLLLMTARNKQIVVYSSLFVLGFIGVAILITVSQVGQSQDPRGRAQEQETVTPSVSTLHAQTTLSLVPEHITVNSGDKFVIDVLLDTKTPVNSLDVSVNYPSKDLSLVKTDTTNSVFEIGTEKRVSGGTIRVIRGSQKPISNSGNIIRLTFKAIGNTSTQANLFIDNSSQVIGSQTHTNILSQSYGSTVTIRKSQAGDINGDSAVNILDLSIFLSKTKASGSGKENIDKVKLLEIVTNYGT